MAKKKNTEEKKLDLDQVFGTETTHSFGNNKDLYTNLQRDPFGYGIMSQTSAMQAETQALKSSLKGLSVPKLSMPERQNYIFNHVTAAEYQLLTGQCITYNAPAVKRLIDVLSRLYQEGIFDLSEESIQPMMTEVVPTVVKTKELTATECLIQGVIPGMTVYISKASDPMKYVRCFTACNFSGLKVSDASKIIIRDTVAQALGLTPGETKVNVSWRAPDGCEVIYL